MQTLAMTFLDSEIELQQFQFLHYNSTFVEVDLRNAFTLHPYYFIAFDLVNSSYTPSADGSAITGVSAVTFFYIFTFQLLQVGSAYSRFRLSTTSVLLH